MNKLYQKFFIFPIFRTASLSYGARLRFAKRGVGENGPKYVVQKYLRENGSG